jgi:hypothetical protein
MYSKFWDNVRGKLTGKKDGQKWLALESGVGRTTINNGIAKLNKPEPAGPDVKNSPSVDNAYAIARALAVTIEELVDGEAGIDHVRQWAKSEGKVYEPPERIADIVASINGLADRELEIVRGTISGILASGTQGETASPPLEPKAEDRLTHKKRA